MKSVLGLFVITIGLTLILKYVITPKYGEDVSGRFIERMNYIPSQKPRLLSRETLSQWLSEPGNHDAIAGYVFPTLIPLDIAFLVSLGLLLGLSSLALAGSFPFLSNVPAWVWWLFPVGYMVSDLAEDAVVVAIFKLFTPLTDATFGVLKTLTAIKLASVSAAIGQVGFLSVLYVVLWLFPASKSI
ncbi:MAG TPA: hypothetical protein VGC77_12415 [Rhodopseudomonas sp.]|uniref:hypothetical protein n=1 Tax=Rhodopseudomonas sp. TaxID=1078 RepID=UPI002ED934D8